MTKESFIAFVNEKLNSGNDLTKDDVYEIGKKHRELPKSERSWAWVADLIHWKGTGESLRGFVLRRMKEEGLVDSPVDLNNEDSLVKKRAELYRERQQVRDEWSTYNRMMREDARIETFKEAIQDAARVQKPFKKVSYHGSTLVDVEAIAMLSDLHIGVEFDDFCNRYNLEIAKQRVSKYVDDVRRYCTLHKVKRLNVVNLGDLISGIIHTTIRLEQEFDVISQIMNASEILAGILNDLQDVAPEVV